MNIIWRSRPIKSDRSVEILTDPKSTVFDRPSWQPIYCHHRGAGRIAFTASVMYSDQIKGKLKRGVFCRLPTIRSCCVEYGLGLAAWWSEVETILKFWAETENLDEAAYIRRDRDALLDALREVVPKPTPAAIRRFVAFRDCREAEKEAAYGPGFIESRDNICRENAERRREEKRYPEPKQHSRSRRGARFDFLFSAGFDDDNYAVLRLARGATLEQVKARHRLLAKQHHPDRGGDPVKFCKIQAAYEKIVGELGLLTRT